MNILKTCKLYECKYLEEVTIDGDTKIFLYNTYCDKFITNGTCARCYVDNKGKYYRLFAVNDEGKWEHPIKFIDKKLGDEYECVEEKLEKQ